METLFFKHTEKDIEHAAKIIKGGGLVAFPTETVYGLGANALDAEAVGKVYKAKGRPSDNPMIVHIARKEDLKKLCTEVTEDILKLMNYFWPGPLTLVTKRRDIVPLVTTGGLETVAIRMPNDEIALALIEKSGCPIAAPSANLSGKPSPTKAEHVVDDLCGRIDGIIFGKDCQVGIESTVLDVTTDIPTILRPGIITKHQIESVLGKKIEVDKALLLRPDKFNNSGEELLQDLGEDFKPKAPGMKYKHYAPKAEMIIYEGPIELVEKTIEDTKEKREKAGEKVGVILYKSEESEKAAKDFFAELRHFDKENVDVILAAALDEDGVGFSVMNRMLKSAGYNIISLR